MANLIVTYASELELEDIRARLSEVGAELVEGAEPIPLSPNETSIEVETEDDGHALEAIDGVLSVHPSSDMSFY